MFTRTEEGKKCLNLDSLPIALLILVATVTICFLKKDFHLLRRLDILCNLFVQDLRFYWAHYD